MFRSNRVGVNDTESLHVTDFHTVRIVGGREKPITDLLLLSFDNERQ